MDAVKSVRTKYNGKDYKLGQKDCFSYAIDVLKKLEANVNPKGKGNSAKFDSIKGCN